MIRQANISEDNEPHESIPCYKYRADIGKQSFMIYAPSLEEAKVMCDHAIGATHYHISDYVEAMNSDPDDVYEIPLESNS